MTKAIKKKYGWTHPQYLPRFVDDESVAATLRLDVQMCDDPLKSGARRCR